VGEGARGVHTGALAAGAADGEESLLVPDVDAAVALLEAQLRPGDVVLVKASRAIGLEQLAAGLLEPPAGPRNGSAAGSDEGTGEGEAEVR